MTLRILLIYFVIWNVLGHFLPFSNFQVFQYCEKCVTTQFEIECRFSGHTVTKNVKTALQILLAKPKICKNLYFYK